MMALGPGAHGADLRAAGDGGFGAVSYAGALLGQFAGIQFCGDSGGVAGAVYCNMAGERSNMWGTTGLQYVVTLGVPCLIPHEVCPGFGGADVCGAC
jgi:hypothetical protein